MARTPAFGTSASLLVLGLAAALPARAADLEITLLGRYESGIFDRSGAEIVAYEPTTKRLYVVNGASASLDILDISDPRTPTRVATTQMSAYGRAATSVAVMNGMVAVAVAGRKLTDRGSVVFFDPDGAQTAQLPVGVLPDMLTFTPDGAFVLTANEGEPAADYSSDPEGSVSIIDVSGGPESLAAARVREVSLRAFDAAPPAGVRVFGPKASFSADAEPEYIAVSPDSRTAYVVLQENNAIARIDIAAATVTDIISLGYTDHRQVAFDPSDKDGGARLAPWPVRGLYLPDGIAAFEAGGLTYLITANEGDSRDYDGFSEEARVEDLRLDPAAFPNAAALQKPSALGRLQVTTTLGDEDGDGDYDALYAFGARSLSVWTTEGQLVADTGDAIERLIADRDPAHFNSDNTDNDSADSRSDNKGPEPEGVTVGRVGDTLYAFAGLERISAIVAFDLTDPAAPRLAGYASSRSFGGDPSEGTAGDLGPEGVLFIPAAQSPNGEALLAVGNEVSGTTALYAVREN